MRQEIIAEENKLMMMDPNGMNGKKAYWKISREEILRSRMPWAGILVLRRQGVLRLLRASIVCELRGWLREFF
jgi:hypothetical protein